jgi:hypothetical protein
LALVMGLAVSKGFGLARRLLGNLPGNTTGGYVKSTGFT